MDQKKSPDPLPPGAPEGKIPGPTDTTSIGTNAPRPEIVETPLPAGYRFYLRALTPNCPFTTSDLSKARQTIGRSDADIVIDNTSISRKHAAIEVYDVDFAYIKDLASTNGTYLNGEMINAAKLRTGDVIMIGECQLEFVVEPL